jgi:hypothetical protein
VPNLTSDTLSYQERDTYQMMIACHTRPLARPTPVRLREADGIQAPCRTIGYRCECGQTFTYAAGVVQCRAFHG